MNCVSIKYIVGELDLLNCEAQRWMPSLQGNSFRRPWTRKMPCYVLIMMLLCSFISAPPWTAHWCATLLATGPLFGCKFGRSCSVHPCKPVPAAVAAQPANLSMWPLTTHHHPEAIQYTIHRYIHTTHAVSRQPVPCPPGPVPGSTSLTDKYPTSYVMHSPSTTLCAPSAATLPRPRSGTAIWSPAESEIKIREMPDRCTV